MAEWLIERGLGETRAALVEDGRIVEARILPDGELIAGTILDARLIARMPERNQGIVAWDCGEALVVPLPAGVTQGAMTRIEIVRPALPEPGKPKRARARPAPATTANTPVRFERSRETGSGATQDFSTSLETNGLETRALRPTDPDLFAAAGWDELIEEAANLSIAFDGGSLSIHPTPAMTLIDVDGWAHANTLAVAGAHAAAQAIRRLDIGGSIGIDLPSAADKAARHAAAAAIDSVLPQPFERTAVNGFGFVQIVRPRRRRSLIEVFAGDGVAAHARALLRRAERTPGAGERTIAAHPAVIAAITPDWIAALSRTLGVPIALRADPALAISAGHVQARHP
ncbi:ribonuclease E/G [Sphingomonas donggukensis]|uniref:Ribonuclease E/G n=1 Tax=Sphingomonas donggukensis TaxID=2949093 RepID=A0ABY4TVZ9_9SPHN|nr:ribonuclease E/G [Sphingomonas donggukensis]URW74503.1 ribonuclease E/G [Sphingomonas donggukensis]